MAGGSSPGASLRVQVVLYHDAPVRVARLVGSVLAAARHARRDGVLGRVEVALGDCSEAPVLDATEVEALRVRASGDEVDLAYRFFDANLGSGGGSNALAEGATTDLLLVLNPDTYLSPTALTELARSVSPADVGAVDARQIPFEHPKEFDLRTGDTAWASGACLMVRRDAFEAVAGFDAEHFPLYCDDVDFSWRVLLAGRRVVHAPRAAVFHDKRLLPDGVVEQSETEVRIGALARLLLCHKWGRPDLVAETADYIESHGSQPQRDALDEFRVREHDGRLPGVVPSAERAARFVGGEYARHRF